MRKKEETLIKKSTEGDKLNALIEQKLELTENELKDYKEKYNQKDKDFKEVNRELGASQKELHKITN